MPTQMEKHYSQLIGFKVVSVHIISEDENPLSLSPTVAFIMAKGKEKLLVTLLSDAEDNDTGFLEISAWQDENS